MISDTEGAGTGLPPAIVLARPQLGENIGKTARAMLNFGLTDLRLVAPRDGWPNPDAGPSASGADEVLAAARVFERVEDAIADLDLVFATTVRRRELAKDVVAPQEAARRIRGHAGRSGILFGAERSGLDNDEVALADAILTIPVNPAFSSLNLAQAAIVVAWEWYRQGDNTPPVRTLRGAAASGADYQGLFEQLEGDLAVRGYFRSRDRRPAQIRSLRTILRNARLSAQEIATLRGVLKTLTWKVRDQGSDGED